MKKHLSIFVLVALVVIVAVVMRRSKVGPSDTATMPATDKITLTEPGEVVTITGEFFEGKGGVGVVDEVTLTNLTPEQIEMYAGEMVEVTGMVVFEEYGCPETEEKVACIEWGRKEIQKIDSIHILTLDTP